MAQTRIPRNQLNVLSELNEVTVAASTASANEKLNADYVCTGTNDDVQINLALQAAKTAGGIVKLSSGTFNLAATLYIEGDNGVDTAKNIALIGKGSRNTRLAPASGVVGITLRYMPKPIIMNLGINIQGTSDGIKSIANTTGANDRRGFWQGYFCGLDIRGVSGGSTGWALNLENPFRSTFINIQVGDTTNGIWCKSVYQSDQSNQFNPGNCNFINCMMGASGVGYRMQSNDNGGFLNIMTFSECDAFGSGTGTIGWHFIGSTTSYFATRDMVVHRSNIEQYNTAVKFEKACNIEVNLNYVDTNASGTVFDVSSNSLNNQLSAQYIYVTSGPKTTKALNDANTSDNAPTLLRQSFARVESGSTLSLTKTSATVLEKLYRDTDGTGIYPSEWQYQTTALNVKNNGTELFRGTRSINFSTGLTATNSNGDVTVTASSSGGFANPMTTQGDIIYGGTSGAATRLGTGTGFLRGGSTPSYSAVSLASSDVSGILPVVNGGTGSSTQNFVDLTTNQTIGGTKTFSTATNFSAGLSITGQGFRIVPAIVTAASIAITTASSAYQLMNATSNSIAVTLPSTTTAGLTYYFKKTDSSTNAVTISSTSIDGASSITLTRQYDFTMVISTSTAGTWSVLDSNVANKVVLPGSTSGTTTLVAASVAGSTTLALPAINDTLVGKTTVDSLANKTLITPLITGGLSVPTTPSAGFGLLYGAGSNAIRPQWMTNSGVAETILTSTTATNSGYVQSTSTFSVSSSTQTQVTGLSLTITASGTRSYKITAYAGAAFGSATGSPIEWVIWKGTVGTGTRLNGATFTPRGVNDIGVVNAVAVDPTPTAGSITYNVGMSVGSGTAQTNAQANYPVYLLVEPI